MKEIERHRHVNFKVKERVYLRVEEVSEKLNLNVSEVLRRAVVEGLRSFDNARLPGSSIATEQDT